MFKKLSFFNSFGTNLCISSFILPNSRSNFFKGACKLSLEAREEGPLFVPVSPIKEIHGNKTHCYFLRFSIRKRASISNDWFSERAYFIKYFGVFSISLDASLGMVSKVDSPNLWGGFASTLFALNR